MRPAVTVLQLDTHFPRVPGDVACPETYTAPIEIIRIPDATVGEIVTDAPMRIDITSFSEAIQAARGDVIVTSCGFLAPWQGYLAKKTERPFFASALNGIANGMTPQNTLILTFDEARLGSQHLTDQPAFAASIVGMPPVAHLRQVIGADLPRLDTSRAEAELVAHLVAHVRPQHRHLLLECTNLPPYKASMRAATGLDVTDILTLIESARPGTVSPDYL